MEKFKKMFKKLGTEKGELFVADLRPKLLIAFLVAMAAMILFWVLRLACTSKVTFWYGVFNFFYGVSRFSAVVLLIALILAWGYLIAFSVRDFFGPNGSRRVFTAEARPNIRDDDDSDEFSLDFGDLSGFDGSDNSDESSLDFGDLSDFDDP
ncbi:hypothetical protein IIZ81_03795 [Candidatus Saccharibacteria bacterium]|nr:hypothetical protein [Candidatus Saccharibacteria bacterium]